MRAIFEAPQRDGARPSKFLAKNYASSEIVLVAEYLHHFASVTGAGELLLHLRLVMELVGD